MSTQKSIETGDGRARTWTAVVYPDSAPPEWRDILDGYMIAWAESPLHEYDTNPDGTVKKPHWHIILTFEGKKSYEQIVDMLSPLNCPIPQRVQSIRGATRYLCHMDNPEKYQYPRSDIVAHGGYDLDTALKLSSSQRYAVVRDMQKYCRENVIIDYNAFCDYCAQYHFDDWFPLLVDSCTYVMSSYIKGIRDRYYRDNNNA